MPIKSKRGDGALETFKTHPIKDSMEAAQLLGLAKDLQLHPDMIEMGFDEAWAVHEYSSNEGSIGRTEEQIMHRVDHDHSTHIKVG